MRGRKRTRNWPEGSRLSPRHCEDRPYSRWVEGRLEYCGDELRHGLAGREDAVAFEFLDKGAAAKRVRSEPTSGNRGGFSLIMDETYLENDPLSFQILQNLRRVAFGSLVEGQRKRSSVS